MAGCSRVKRRAPGVFARVVESIMIFALGFLAAALIALLIIPAINARADRLARRRAEALFPLSISELTAQKDHRRAAGRPRGYGRTSRGDGRGTHRRERCLVGPPRHAERPRGRPSQDPGRT